MSEGSGSHALSREHLPGCCVNLEGELAWAWCPSGCKTWGDESLGRSVWTIWSRLRWWCMTKPWRCLTSGTVPETWVEAKTQLMGAQLCPLWLEVSVKRVISASKALSETPCSTAGEDHQAASWRIVRVTEILSDQNPVSWHQASDAHHWIGRGGKADLLALSLHKGQNAQNFVEIPGGDVRVRFPVCSGFWLHFGQRCHSVGAHTELHANEIELLAGW